MNELNSDRSFIKSEHLSLDSDLDLQDCIEDFDRIIYQTEEFTLNSDFSHGDSSQNLSSEFTFSIVGDGDRG